MTTPTHESDAALLADAARNILTQSEGQPTPNTLVLPDTKAGRRLAAHINRMTTDLLAGRGHDIEIIEDVAPSRLPQPLRSHRRRSRQCRGPRARNYARSMARAKTASSSTSACALVFADATSTGAFASSILNPL